MPKDKATEKAFKERQAARERQVKRERAVKREREVKRERAAQIKAEKARKGWLAKRLKGTHHSSSFVEEMF
jgi:hypothetical protein